jgi:hypothetical protein
MNIVNGRMVSITQEELEKLQDELKTAVGDKPNDGVTTNTNRGFSCVIMPDGTMHDTLHGAFNPLDESVLPKQFGDQIVGEKEIKTLGEIFSTPGAPSIKDWRKYVKADDE